MPISAPIGAALIGAGGNILGSLAGGGRGQAVVPKDLQGFRGDTIALLRSLLQPGAFGPGGAGTNFFGQLGLPQNALQRQASTGIEQFLNQPSPEQRAFDVSRPILEGMLTGTGPQFERDIASANQQGGRFGSANAILRGEALRNLFNMRTQTAQTLGMLAQQSADAPFQRMLGGLGAGSQLAQQSDLETQRRLQLLVGLLGQGTGATLGLPVTQAPNLGQTIGQAGFDFAQLLALLGGRNRPGQA